MKPLFFDGYKIDGYNFNIANDDYSDVIAYEIPEVRENLFKWWYNYILQDIMKTGIKDNVIYADKEINEIDMPLSNYDTNLSEADRKLLAELWPLMDENGQFTPYNDDDNTNISKDLLNGKTVTFDIRSITDKNVRALLDGQLLSSDELTVIKFTLNGIRYNRNSKILGVSTQWDNEALKDSKKEIEETVIKEIEKIKFEGKDNINVVDLPQKLQSDIATELIKSISIKEGNIQIRWNF